jgi:hypothetical protein
MNNSSQATFFDRLLKSLSDHVDLAGAGISGPRLRSLRLLPCSCIRSISDFDATASGKMF